VLLYTHKNAVWKRARIQAKRRRLQSIQGAVGSGLWVADAQLLASRRRMDGTGSQAHRQYDCTREHENNQGIV